MARTRLPWRNAFRRAFFAVFCLAVFLRLPLHGSPTPSWPPELPAEPVAEARAPEPVRRTPNDAPLSLRTHSEPEAFHGAFMYVPPSNALVRPLVGADTDIAELLETRLDDLMVFGDQGGRADTMYLLGIERQRALDFSAAADYFEAFASAPLSDLPRLEAAAALETAIAYRRALNQPDLAARAERSFERFETIDPRAATRVALSGPFASLMRLRERRLPPAERIQVEVRIGKALWRRDRHEALRAFRRAERTWQRSGGAAMATSPGLDALAWLSELSRVRESLAEARFMRADVRFRALRTQHAPAFRGRAEAGRVSEWMQKRLRPWLERRLARMNRVEGAFDTVDAIGLSTFSVAAAARRGELYVDLFSELERALPKVVEADEGRLLIPAENVRSDPSIRARVVSPAIAHFEECMRVASHTRAYGEWSEHCADGLARWVDAYRFRPERGPLLETPERAAALTFEDLPDALISN